MIDFTTLKSLKIPEGVVVKITDINGNKLWEFNETENNSTVVLQVQKIASDTYINETTYTDESFILLNIYPKTNGTVSVTYEGLTKTITDTSGEAEPEAQKVFFGTFNGVSDSVITPTNGTLTIDGDYRGFGCGTYNITKINATSCPCVEDIVNWGIVNFIPGSAFKGCEKLTSIVIPEAVVEIESYAFSNCVNLTSIILPEGIRTINNHTFYNCTSLSSIIIPSSVSGIGNYAFYNCTNLSSITIPDGLVLINNYAF